VELLRRTIRHQADIIHEDLHNRFGLIKDAGFREEKEYRIIHKADAKGSKHHIHHKIANNMLIPYVKLPLFRDVDKWK
jgi:hypothetical protein